MPSSLTLAKDHLERARAVLPRVDTTDLANVINKIIRYIEFVEQLDQKSQNICDIELFRSSKCVGTYYVER